MRLHEMGAGYFIMLVTAVVPCDIKIPAPEPILPLINGHLAFDCLWQINQDFLPARTRELAKDWDGAVTFGFLPKRLKIIEIIHRRRQTHLCGGEATMVGEGW